MFGCRCNFKKSFKAMRHMTAKALGRVCKPSCKDFVYNKMIQRSTLFCPSSWANSLFGELVDRNGELIQYKVIGTEKRNM